MMTAGNTMPFHVLSFLHRASLGKGMSGWKDSAIPEQTAQIAAAKLVICEGFKAAVAEVARRHRDYVDAFEKARVRFT